jgi:hypothetical protein
MMQAVDESRDPRWVELTPSEAKGHPRYGLGPAGPILLVGFLWCALGCFARVGLLAYGLYLGDADGLPLSSMVLTYMPVADTAFVVLFLWLAAIVRRPGTRAFAELATIACGLYVLYVIPYVFAFRHLTDTAAFSLWGWQTYAHYVLPVGFCLWVLAYANLSPRARLFFAHQVPRDDPYRAPSGRA